MSGFIAEASRSQTALFPESLDDYIDTDNPVRVIDLFVNELDLQSLGFERTEHAQTGRPGYHPSTLLKLYIYGYLNRIQSSLHRNESSRPRIQPKTFNIDLWSDKTSRGASNLRYPALLSHEK